MASPDVRMAPAHASWGGCMGLLVGRSCVLEWELDGRLYIRGRMGLIGAPFGCPGILCALAWVEGLGWVVKLGWVL